MARQPILVVFAMVVVGVGAGEAFPYPIAAGSLALVWAGITVVAWRAGKGVAISALLTLMITAAWSAALHETPVPLTAHCVAEIPSATAAVQSAGSGATTTRWRGVVDATTTRAVDPATHRVVRRTELTDLRELCAGSWQPRTGRVSVGLWRGEPVARGDLIDLRLRIAPLDRPRNPVGADPRDIANRRNLAGRGVATSPHAIVSWGAGPLAQLDRARAAAAIRFESEFTPAIAALAKALSMGDRAAIAPATRDRWGAAGIAHLLAISGLHVGFVAWLLYRLIFTVLASWPRLAERSSVRRIAAVLAGPLVVSFCLWTGASASTIRATIMVVAYLCGLALGRPSSAANALGIAGTGILLLDPPSLHDAGFLLSFTAVAALLLVPRLPTAHSLAQRVGRAIAASIIASVVATVATAPLTAYHFGYVSLVAPLTNLVAVPWATLVTVPLGLAFTIVAPLSAALGSVIGSLLSFALSWLDSIANVGAALPFASLAVPQPSPFEIIAYATLCVAGLFSVRRPRLRWVIAFAVLALAMTIVGRVIDRHGDGELHVYHPYVGQGDAAVIILPGGSVILFDAGGNIRPGGWDPGRQVVAPLLRHLGVRSIDVAIVSHPDPDHIGGFPYLSDHFPIRELWWPGNGEEDRLLQRVLANVRDHGGTTRPVAILPRELEREGVTLRLLHPRPAPEATGGLPYFPELSDNDNSVVLWIGVGKRSLLLPGDLESAGETLVAPSLPVADIIKAPHHGSPSSSTPRFLDAVAARAVVISCGDGNRFGFPNAGVVARYREHNMTILRTDTDGMIELHTGGNAWRINTYRGGPRSLGEH